MLKLVWLGRSSRHATLALANLRVVEGLANVNVDAWTFASAS